MSVILRDSYSTCLILVKTCVFFWGGGVNNKYTCMESVTNSQAFKYSTTFLHSHGVKSTQNFGPSFSCKYICIRTSSQCQFGHPIDTTRVSYPQRTLIGQSGLLWPTPSRSHHHRCCYQSSQLEFKGLRLSCRQSAAARSITTDSQGIFNTQVSYNDHANDKNDKNKNKCIISNDDVIKDHQQQRRIVRTCNPTHTISQKNNESRPQKNISSKKKNHLSQTNPSKMTKQANSKHKLKLELELGLEPLVPIPPELIQGPYMPQQQRHFLYQSVNDPPLQAPPPGTTIRRSKKITKRMLQRLRINACKQIWINTDIPYFPDIPDVQTFYKDQLYLIRNCFSKVLCDTLIKVANKIPWDIDQESVDGGVLWQHNVLAFEGDTIVDDTPEISRALFPETEAYLKDIIASLMDYPFMDELVLTFCFLRKYTPRTRKGILLHKDSSKFTLTVQLASADWYRGGHLYIWDLPTSEKIVSMEPTTGFEPNSIQKVLDTYDPDIIKPQQGQALLHRGPLYHMVQDVTEGHRYSLIFFFDGP